MGRKIYLILDGASDDPVESLGGRTPLEAAHTPHLDSLAKIGVVGWIQTVPPEFTAASDVANLTLLGHDPRGVYSGRGPLEAAAMGIPLEEGEIAFRVNTISIAEDDKMKDYSAGHITTPESAEIIAACQPLAERLGGTLYPGVQYRHLMRRRDGAEITSYPPHDNIGVPIASMKPPGVLGEFVDESRKILKDHPVNVKRRAAGKNAVDALWPWGQGKAVKLKTIEELYGQKGALVSAVDLIRGIGVLAGFRILNVPGITGYHDTDYAAKAKHAIAALEWGDDIVVIHVESPDEAGHEKDVAAKVRAIEAIDRDIVGPLIARVPKLAIVAAPDHATYVATGKHGAGPVPYLIADMNHPLEGPDSYCERTAKGAPIAGEKPFRRLMGLSGDGVERLGDPSVAPTWKPLPR
jgi:2,3-bisphosphoglycerate-independent phosphoglycerate mutase